MRLFNILNIIFFKKIIYLNSILFKFILSYKDTFKIILLFLKLSFLFCKKILFLNIFFYNSIFINNKKINITNILNYFFIFDNQLFSITSNVFNNFNSFETYFFNLKWQERECREFLGINFFNKNDNRSLFLWNNFIGYPLKKDFPTVGFFELINKYKIGLFFKKLLYV